LVKELDSKDPGVLLNAARLATNSRSPEVACKLSEVLNLKLLSETDENVKGAVIKALAEMALPEALPGLGQFLLGRNLLQSMQGNRLKVEAVRSLERYSDPAAGSLAEEVYLKTSGELARVAGQACLQLNGKLPWT
jgi:HEAT repeat protein